LWQQQGGLSQSQCHFQTYLFSLQLPQRNLSIKLFCLLKTFHRLHIIWEITAKLLPKLPSSLPTVLTLCPALSFLFPFPSFLWFPLETLGFCTCCSSVW
jgi:hypothetical protein